VTFTPTIAICTHPDPFRLYTTKPVSLFELSTHENLIDDDESAAALSPTGGAGAVVPEPKVVARTVELAQFVPAPF
jgi:hypothetical protein